MHSVIYVKVIKGDRPEQGWKRKAQRSKGAPAPPGQSSLPPLLRMECGVDVDLDVDDRCTASVRIRG